MEKEVAGFQRKLRSFFTVMSYKQYQITKC